MLPYFRRGTQRFRRARTGFAVARVRCAGIPDPGRLPPDRFSIVPIERGNPGKSLFVLPTEPLDTLVADSPRPSSSRMKRFVSATPRALGSPLGSPRRSRAKCLSPTSATDSMTEHPPSRSTSRARVRGSAFAAPPLRRSPRRVAERSAPRDSPGRLGRSLITAEPSKTEASEDDGTTQDHHRWQPCPGCRLDGRRAHSFDRYAPAACPRAAVPR